MKLRRLHLSGFKTFARQSEIVFDSGITAIVGPNGSGKSNIVDAVRWSLGETNARELRGAKMEEVIYSGGAKKGRMSVAEVELILDNEDGRIPIEGAEVSVGRRVTRRGDSEYRLNGDRVRLKDIERSLGQTGLTQTGYSVVAQNDIDGIIQATPSQRRALVEQAAGVRSLRAASEDSLDKISKAGITLRRLDDILDEAEPRLAELAEQAELATEQAGLTERLAELRGSLAREEWRAARGQLRQARRRRDLAATRFAAAAEVETSFASRFEAQRDAVQRAREMQRDAVTALETARLAAERAAGEARRWLDRQRAAVLQRSATVAEHALAQRDIDSAAATLAALAASGANVEAEASDAEVRVTEAIRLHEAAVAAAADCESAVAGAEAALEEAGNAWSAAADARRDAATRVDVLTESIRAMGGEATAVRERVRQLDEELVGRQERAQLSAAALADAETATQALRDALTMRRSQVHDADAQLATLREASRATVSRAATLRGQIEGALGGRGAVAAAVDAGEIDARRLVDCFDVIDSADAAAVEAALEGSLGAWLVSDLDRAAALLTREAGREEIVLANPATLPAAPAPAGTRRVLDAIAITVAGARGALEHILGDAWLAPDFGAAQRAVDDLGGRAVLADGRVVTSVGIRGGGRPGKTLELAAEERAASAAAEAAVAAERTMSARRASLQIAVVADEEALATASAALETARLEAAEATVLHGNTTRAATEERRRLDALDSGLATRQAELADATATADAESRRALDADARLGETRREVEEARGRVLDHRSAVERAAQARRDAEAQAMEAKLLSDDLDRQVAAARHAGDAARARCDATALRLLASESDALTARVRSRRARATAASIAVDVAAAREALDTSVPELAEAERVLGAIEVERSEVAISVARATDERTAADADVAVAEERVAELADVVRDDDDDEGPEPDAQAAEKAEREIIRLERRISALGPVNGLAPAQHAQLEVRVSTVRDSRDDIGMASDDVRALVAVLTDEIEARFDEVFDSVSTAFQELYSELFPGGRATLRLETLAPVTPAATDVEDIDAALAEEPNPKVVRLPGVEILAQPAGKRLQPLSLLSGGERALTALAVILALQKVSASPFYIFDEIDAPLDDANVKRLCRLLKRLSAEQQFIVVTHNHVTMAAADVLYGVTIDGDGVSSVLSVRLAAAEELAEVDVPGLRQSTVPVAAGA